MFVQLEAEALYPAGPEGGKGRGNVLLGEGFEEILLLLLGRFQSAQPLQSPQTSPELFNPTPLPLVSPDPLQEPVIAEPPPEPEQEGNPLRIPIPEENPSTERTAFPLPPAGQMKPEPERILSGQPSGEAPPVPEEPEPVEEISEKTSGLSESSPGELRKPPDPPRELSATVAVKEELRADGFRFRTAPEEPLPRQRKLKPEEVPPEKPSGRLEERPAEDPLPGKEAPAPSGKKNPLRETAQPRDLPVNRPPADAPRRSAERDPAPPGGERSLPADPPSFERELPRPEPRGEVAVSSRTLSEPQPRPPERSSPEEQSLLRRESAPLQSFHTEEVPEAENLTVERREIPHLPKQEVRRIDLRFESAHLRFLLQNENLSVEVSLKERIENHLTYMDAQRLYRNLQTLGVNLEVLRVNGVDLLSRSWKVGRREDRERSNIGEDGNPYPKADRGAPDSADLNLLL